MKRFNHRAAGLFVATIAAMTLFLGPWAAIADQPTSGSQPVTKMCVGSPLRQTEDPNSPPCISYFNGDNGGDTWAGVSSEEVRLLVYLSTAIVGGSNGVYETPPEGTYCDADLLDCNADGVTDHDVHPWLEIANTYSRYFNERFQTFNRRVRTYVYWSNASSPAARRADAADNYERVQPFAVLDQSRFGGHHHAYADAMNRRGVSVFRAEGGTSRTLAEGGGPKVWGFWPDVEIIADNYSSYVCNKVAPTKVTGGEFAGAGRRYAIFQSVDPSFPEHLRQNARIQSNLADCGVVVEAVFSFDGSGWAADTGADRAARIATVAALKLGGYNTILWISGTETDVSKISDLALFRPEWFVAGDGSMESYSYGSAQGQASWANAWITSARTRVGDPIYDPGYQAYRHSHPTGSFAQMAPDFYRDWFLFFSAVQLAGPSLTPSAVETGFRAWTSSSSSPYAVNGSFADGSYTFVKDANEQYWDSTALGENGPGCYRLVLGGRRVSADGWSSATDAGLGKRNEDGTADGWEKVIDRDPCNAYDTTSRYRAGLPLRPGGMTPL